MHYNRFSQSVLILNDCFQYFLAVKQQIVGIDVSASKTLVIFFFSCKTCMTIQTNCLGVDTCTYKISKQVGFEVHVFLFLRKSDL